MKKTLFLLTMLLAGMLTGCDKLDDGDDQIIKELLPGTWVFTYELKSEQETGLEFNYEQVIFQEDGSCAITYIDYYDFQEDEKGEMVAVPVYDALKGTYEAGASVIRISSVMNGQEQIMLWRILSFSAKQITAEYEFELSGQKIIAIVTLDKQ